jgi:hypothetical protein
MDAKQLEEEWRGRAIRREKMKNAMTRIKVSPPPKNIGNLQGAKGFCTHCSPTLANRLNSKQEIITTMKNEIQEFKKEETIPI